MRFLVDAQLPVRLKNWLLEKGHDVIHTFDLPLKNATPDIDLIRLCEKEERIIVTKDSDFHKYYILHGIPKRILIITTGNILNRKLLNLVQKNFSTIESLFEEGKQIIEVNTGSIIVHS